MQKIFRMLAAAMLVAASATCSVACSDGNGDDNQPAGQTPGGDNKPSDGGDGPEPAGEALLTYTIAEAAYWGDDFMVEGVSNLIIYLYDSPRDEDGMHTGPKDHFNIDMNLPNYKGGELCIPAGTYPVGEAEIYAVNTLEPGYFEEEEYDGFIFSDYYGVFRQQIDAEQEERYEIMTAGQMTVSRDATGGYTIEADFTSADGTRYRVTYQGSIEVDDESLLLD